MRLRLFLLLVALLFAVAWSGPFATRAEDAPGRVGLRDWPMWGGTIHRNLANTAAKNIPDTWDVKKGKEKNVKWTARLGTMAYGGPVISGGKIFVGTNNARPRDPKVRGDKGVMMCFREADGQFLWQIVHDKLPNTEENDTPNHGVLSVPVVEGNRLYYVSNRCELVCADRGRPGHGGKVVWKLDMIKELGVYPCYVANSSPLIVGDLVFALTGNGVVPTKFTLPSPKAPDLVAVNKHTGKLVWSDNSPGERIMDGQWSSPVAAEVNGRPLIYAGGDGFLYAFEAKSGKLVWKFDCNPKGATFKPGDRGDKNFIVATPVIWEKKLYVAVGLEPDDCHGAGHLWCVDITREPKNPDKDISPVNNNFDPKAPANKDSGLVWHHGGPIVPKPEDGREVVFARTISTVAVHEGLVYAVELMGYLQCLDAQTGKKYWEYDLKDSVWSSPFYVDGKVFLGTEGGNMFVFRTGKELKEPGKVALDQPLKVPPVAVNGVLFVNTGANLFAIANK